MSAGHVFWWVLGVPAALLFTGFFYQWIGARLDRRRYASLGRWVSIGQGVKHYLLEHGSGHPTVIFESGIAATNLNWHGIQKMVAEFTHTVSYDRAGLGWSSRALTLRTPNNIAVELHAVLHEAGIKPPYVLVGHSFGGLVMRRFAVLYPNEVDGVVLVDPMRLEEWPPLDPAKQAMLDRGVKMSTFGIPFARAGLARLAVTSLLCRSGKFSDMLAQAGGDGGMHVLGRIKSEVGKMPRAVWPIVAAHWSRPGYYAGMRAHVMAVPDTVREMLDAEPIFGIPVLLLTPGAAVAVSELGMNAIGDDVEQVIAHRSEHWIHLDEPEMVVEAIREMVDRVTAGAAVSLVV